MSPGRFFGFWSVHNSEIAQRRNYIKYWAMFYEAFGAGWPNGSDAYIRQLAAVERDVLQEFLGVMNNENKEPARIPAERHQEAHAEPAGDRAVGSSSWAWLHSLSSSETRALTSRTTRSR
ncbi:hypothetical protein MRX96_011558 [Rhipicephalus microplus]